MATRLPKLGLFRRIGLAVSLGTCFYFFIYLQLQQLPKATQLSITVKPLLQFMVYGSTLSFAFIAGLWAYLEMRFRLHELEPHSIATTRAQEKFPEGFDGWKEKVRQLEKSQKLLMWIIPVGVGVIALILTSGIAVISWLLTRVP